MLIGVLIELEAEVLDKIFTYSVPIHLNDKVKLGVRVHVPFGYQKLEGFVVKTNVSNNSDYEIKDIIDVIDDIPIINKELMSIGKYISDTCLCKLITAYQAMLPSAYKAKIKNEFKIKTIKYIKLNKDIVEINQYIEDNKRAKKQIEILNCLKNTEMIEKTIFDNTVVKKLVDKGLITIIEKEVDRFKINNILEKKNITLTDKQQNVANEIINHLDNNITYLLHGVTGSGKTEVYIEIIKEVLKNGKDALMLVPEISLTPQMVSRFTNVFGDNIAVLHSGLSNVEKYDEYRKIINRKVNIVIGARSAVFAPLSKLGVIIIDEEHTSSYKQDNYPRYHAIDIAKFRSKYNTCPLILGSATPSLESYARAKKGVYKLLELKTRVGMSVLPKINIIDMKEENKQKYSIFSKILIESIKDRLNKKEQVILLLNRRGYSTFITCKNCGYTHKCPNCDISLTYHKTNDMMRCHYCGYSANLLKVCPECGSSEIKDLGYGTEKVEEELNKLFYARIVRMDVDTTSKKGSHEKIIKDFKEEKYDILLGTQMIAKGLDFPKVSLVGVINADTSLNIPDYRSSENTYQLLSQVAGRAGRSDLKGEVIIQTFNPDHYSILLTKTHDYELFYNKEMPIRKMLKYPPYYYITIVRILSKDYKEGSIEATKVKNYIKNNISDSSIVLGPTTAFMFKLNNIYRFQCIIKYKKDDKLLKTLKTLVNHYKLNKLIRIEIDNNPNKL